MNIVRDTIDIDPEYSRYTLQKATEDLGVLIDLDRVLEIMTAAVELQRPVIRQFREMADDKYLSSDSRGFISLYADRFGVPSHKLMYQGKPSASKPVRKLLSQDMEISESARHFARLHQAVSDFQTIIKAMKSYMALPVLDQVSFEGHRMTQAKPLYTLLSTYRCQASDPNVQNIGRTFPDIITTLADYELVRCDSAQIEPKIQWSHFMPDKLIQDLITAYKDAYFGLLHYILLNPQEERGLRKGSIELQTKPYSKDDRKALKLAGLAAGYGSNLEGKDVPYANLYVERINGHPLRKAWEDEIKEYVRNGGTTFYTAFGLPITPDETQKYKKGSYGWINHLVRCGLNNPIQGTASQLMFVSIDTAMKVLRGRRSKICFYKHDEGAYYVHRSEMDIIDELKETTAYQVYKDGKQWLPIEADALVGKKEGNGFGKGNMKEIAESKSVTEILADIEDLDVT